jgi:hypothetical protein
MRDLQKKRASDKAYNEQHRAERRAYNAAYYLKHRVKILAKVKRFNKENYQKNHTQVLNQQREYRLRIREKAMMVIAKNYGDSSPRCRPDTLGDHPLATLPCYGSIQIDHVNGGGRKELRSPKTFYHGIVNGSRQVNDLRLLCQLHQLWNIPPHPRRGPQ